MTEWCYGNHVVLKEHQDHYDRLPSPDTWMQWETCGGVGGNFGWANNFDFGAIDNAKPPRRTLFSEAGNQEMSQFHAESDDFGVSSGDSRSSFLQNASACVRPDYYVNDDLMTGTDPTDDIFLYKPNLWSLIYCTSYNACRKSYVAIFVCLNALQMSILHIYELRIVKFGYRN